MRKQTLNECIAKADLFIKKANELQQSDPYEADYFRFSDEYSKAYLAAMDLLDSLMDLHEMN